MRQRIRLNEGEDTWRKLRSGRERIPYEPVNPDVPTDEAPDILPEKLPTGIPGPNGEYIYFEETIPTSHDPNLFMVRVGDKWNFIKYNRGNGTSQLKNNVWFDEVQDVNDPEGFLKVKVKFEGNPRFYYNWVNQRGSLICPNWFNYIKRFNENGRSECMERGIKKEVNRRGKIFEQK